MQYTYIHAHRAGPRLKFRWGRFSNREAVRWGGVRFRWGGKFPPFNTENTGKTGFMPANFVIHNLSSSQLSQISLNSNLKPF